MEFSQKQPFLNAEMLFGISYMKQIITTLSNDIILVLVSDMKF